MKLKLDENLSRHLKPLLARMGHDVQTAGDEGLLSRPDREVAAAACREARILLTLDVEFADIRKYPPGSHPGIILFRPATRGPLAVNEFIKKFIRSAELDRYRACVAVVDPVHIRVRYPGNKG